MELVDWECRVGEGLLNDVYSIMEETKCCVAVCGIPTLRWSASFLYV